jgi:DNA-binding NarL/FixJ family response regulator
MGSKTILIFNTESLLIGGVKSLLDAMDDFIVANIPVTENIIPAQEIEQSKPDIVIMDDETAFLIAPMQFLEIFRAVPSLRLIILDRQISRMDVYDKHELSISHPDRFIEALI